MRQRVAKPTVFMTRRAGGPLRNLSYRIRFCGCCLLSFFLLSSTLTSDPILNGKQLHAPIGKLFRSDHEFSFPKLCFVK